MIALVDCNNFLLDPSFPFSHSIFLFDNKQQTPTHLEGIYIDIENNREELFHKNPRCTETWYN